MYKGRTSVERVNARLKVFWGVDDGNIRGARRFVAEVGVVLAVHATFATLLASAPRREGTLGKLKLGPIAEALARRRNDSRSKSDRDERTTGIGPDENRGARRGPQKPRITQVNGEERRKTRSSDPLRGWMNPEYKLQRNRPASAEPALPRSPAA